jgi:hypothetical protein
LTDGSIVSPISSSFGLALLLQIAVYIILYNQFSCCFFSSLHLPDGSIVSPISSSSGLALLLEIAVNITLYNQFRSASSGLCIWQVFP